MTPITVTIECLVDLTVWIWEHMLKNYKGYNLIISDLVVVTTMKVLAYFLLYPADILSKYDNPLYFDIPMNHSLICEFFKTYYPLKRVKIN